MARPVNHLRCRPAPPLRATMVVRERASPGRPDAAVPGPVRAPRLATSGGQAGRPGPRDRCSEAAQKRRLDDVGRWPDAGRDRVSGVPARPICGSVDFPLLRAEARRRSPHADGLRAGPSGRVEPDAGTRAALRSRRRLSPLDDHQRDVVGRRTERKHVGEDRLAYLSGRAVLHLAQLVFQSVRKVAVVGMRATMSPNVIASLRGSAATS